MRRVWQTLHAEFTRRYFWIRRITISQHLVHLGHKFQNGQTQETCSMHYGKFCSFRSFFALQWCGCLCTQIYMHCDCKNPKSHNQNQELLVTILGEAEELEG
jgi:hypothetical protein